MGGNEGNGGDSPSSHRSDATVAAPLARSRDDRDLIKDEVRR